MAAADGVTRAAVPPPAPPPRATPSPPATPSRDELAARYAALYETLRRCAGPADAAGELPGEVLAALRSSGILGAAIATEYGGHGGDAVLTNRLVEQVAAADPSVAIILFQHYAVSARISEWGTPGQCARYLPELASGAWIAASAWSESGATADKRNLATTAVRADGGWVLDGAKTFTTAAGLAQVYLVLAQSARPTRTASAYGSDGQTFYLVEAGNPGLTADTGTDLVGMRASATGFVELTACHVADSAVLGPVGDAVRIIAGVRESGATLGAVSLGIAESAYQLALAHARRRGLAGAQAVRHRLVDLGARVAATRALVDSAGRRDTSAPGDTTLHSKLVASQLSEEVVTEALRLLGSAGYLRDHALNKLARDVRAVGLMGPTNDLCRELASAAWTT
ncbi:acyl-CoA dehydrogenase family protein [Streptomyces sp. TRM 70351]|uniref:acyl-CoA dehydrogenase family protein n=1 Tax=Streptomyces sp. TRM 70351 TaxID=3116552 RepID=UPI002E7BDC43|nr:acyl-CoA dehydrogenase family protein [Streptomyces sp. TRM 70351]MEE1929413.1 acyl-CoA dehydrogenase family protein [Streptomyces sp. TRM 70351]